MSTIMGVYWVGWTNIKRVNEHLSPKDWNQAVVSLAHLTPRAPPIALPPLPRDRRGELKLHLLLHLRVEPSGACSGCTGPVSILLWPFFSGGHRNRCWGEWPLCPLILPLEGGSGGGMLMPEHRLPGSALKQSTKCSLSPPAHSVELDGQQRSLHSANSSQ